MANERGIYNNRIKAISVYINGILCKNAVYLTGGTFSSNLGIYGLNILKNQFSGKMNIQYLLKNNTLLLGHVEFDIGTLYSKNLGFSFIYRKNL